MTSLTWAERAQKAIDRVHREIPPDATEAQARKALSDAYPFGPREMHPYKIWCREVVSYLTNRFPDGVKARSLNATQQRRMLARGTVEAMRATEDGQVSLFDEEEDGAK